MAIHRKARPRIHRKRRRREKRKHLKAKGLDLNDFFSSGFYIGKKKE
jgi:hypothetical protein